MYEDAFFTKVKDEINIVKEHPGMVAGVALTSALLLMRGPRRFLFRNTLGRFQSEEGLFVKVEKNVTDINMSIDIMKKEGQKLLQRASLAEKEMLSGRSALRYAWRSVDITLFLYCLQEKVKDKLLEIQQERSEVGSTVSFTPEQQIEIITGAKGKRKGTCVLGSSIRRPPLPRGGVTANLKAYEELQAELARNKEELQKANEERAREREEAEAFRRELIASFKALSEQVFQATGVSPPNPLPSEDNGRSS